MDRFIEPILDPKYKILEKTTAATPQLRITGSALISPLLSFFLVSFSQRDSHGWAGKCSWIVLAVWVFDPIPQLGSTFLGLLGLITLSP